MNSYTKKNWYNIKLNDEISDRKKLDEKKSLKTKFRRQKSNIKNLAAKFFGSKKLLAKYPTAKNQAEKSYGNASGVKMCAGKC